MVRDAVSSAVHHLWLLALKDKELQADVVT